MGGPREFDSDRFALPLRAHREAIQEIPRPRECVSGADGFAEFGQFELLDPRAHLLLPEDFIAFLEKHRLKGPRLISENRESNARRNRRLKV